MSSGQPRVTALLGALCLFACAPEGITNGRLRPVVAELLGVATDTYTPRQMGYDLRRLERKALLRRVPGKLCYTLTPFGRRAALFLTKVHARVLRPGLHALDAPVVAHVPPPLLPLRSAAPEPHYGPRAPSVYAPVRTRVRYDRHLGRRLRGTTGAGPLSEDPRLDIHFSEEFVT